MEQERIYERALEVMRENFGHVMLISVASSVNDKVSVRDLNAYYYDGMFFAVGKEGNTLLHDIAINPHVGICHGSHNMQGIAENWGHPLDPKNASVRKYMKKEFSLNYDEYVGEDDPKMCIVVIKLTKAETFTRHHRYFVDYETHYAERDHSEPLFIYR